MAITVKVTANETSHVKEVKLVPTVGGSLSNFDISSLNNEELDDEGSTDNSISGLLETDAVIGINGAD